jgi:hypothetical protein
LATPAAAALVVWEAILTLGWPDARWFSQFVKVSAELDAILTFVEARKTTLVLAE